MVLLNGKGPRLEPRPVWLFLAWPHVASLGAHWPLEITPGQFAGTLPLMQLGFFNLPIVQKPAPAKNKTENQPTKRKTQMSKPLIRWHFLYLELKLNEFPETEVSGHLL